MGFVVVVVLEMGEGWELKKLNLKSASLSRIKEN